MKVYRYSSEKEIVSVALGFRPNSSKSERQVCYALKRPRRVGTPYEGLYGETPPERGTFFRLEVYDRVKQIFNKSKALGILLAEIYKRAAKFVIWVCERAQKG